MITIEDFKIKCNKGYCTRGTIKSKVCVKESKQDLCYKKYLAQQEKKKETWKEVDYEWEELKRNILIRDESCVVSKILTKEEILAVEKQEGFWLNAKFLDGAHVIPRATLPSCIYDETNVVIMGRFFHSRIDKYLDLVTGEYIGAEGCYNWWTRIMQQNGYWVDGYTYYDFKKEKMGIL